jgi:hypothetical protein
MTLDEDLLKPENLSVRLVSETRQTFGTEAARQLPAMLETGGQLDFFAGNTELVAPPTDG